MFKFPPQLEESYYSSVLIAIHYYVQSSSETQLILDELALRMSRSNITSPSAYSAHMARAYAAGKLKLPSIPQKVTESKDTGERSVKECLQHLKNYSPRLFATIHKIGADIGYFKRNPDQYVPA